MTDREVEIEIAQLRHALGTLISWMVQSANSPIRFDEAAKLLEILNGKVSK